MKKRWFTVILILTLILPLCGCSIIKDKVDDMSSNSGTPVDDNQGEAYSDILPSLPLFTTVNYNNLYGNTPGTYQVICEIKTEGLILYSTEFDNLQKALQINNEAALANSKEYYTYASNNYFTYDDTSVPWSYNNTINLVRNDSDIVSFKRNINTYLGGPHGSYRTECFNYNPKSGSLISIDAIITDMDRFLKILEKDINENYTEADLYDNWKETLYSQTPYYEYLLTDTGLKIIFNPEVLAIYAVSQIIIDLPYKEYSDLFSKDFTNPNPQNIWDVTDYKNFPIPNVDVDGDGKDEYLRIQYPQDYFENYRNYEGYTIDIWFGNSETEAEARLITVYVETSMEKTYLLKTPLGKYYLLVETSGANDWHFLDIIDLTDPEGGPYSLGDAGNFALYSYRPLNTEYIYCITRSDVMGTAEIFRPYKFTEDGTFEPLSDEYEYSYEHINFDALFDSSNGLPYRYDTEWKTNPIILNKDYDSDFPKGTVLTRFKTDGEFYVTFINADKKELTLMYETNEAHSYPRTINGIPEEDILLNIIYAG